MVWLTVVFLPSCAQAQGTLMQLPPLTDSLGRPIAGATINVFTTTGTLATGLNCASPVTVYKDVGLTVPFTTLLTDGSGNFPFFLLPSANPYGFTVGGVGTATSQCYGFSAPVPPTSSPTFLNVNVTGTLGVTGLASLKGGGLFGGLWNKFDPTTNSILQLEDLGTRNAQLIGFGVEQFLNPASDAAYLNFGSVTELLIPSSNTKNFSGTETGVYGTFSNFGSGTFSVGVGAGFEGFNPGPSTALLIGGVSATANNGGVVTGVPLPNQTPTNNGNATNLRAFDGLAKNWSSGTVTNGVAFYAESPQNTGGGTFTNAYGLFVADMTAAANNFAIRTGQGKVSIGDATTINSTAAVTATLGVGIAASAGVGVFVFSPSPALIGTSQIGVESAIQTSSTATAEGAGIITRADTAAAAYVQGLNTGVHVTTPTVGAGSTITEWDGVRIEPGPTAGTKCSLNIGGSTSGFTCVNTSAVAGGTAAPVISTSFTTTAATTDNVTVTGMTSTGHCKLQPTNTAAAAGIASVFVSAKAANQITVTHTATANWTFDVMCSPI